MVEGLGGLLSKEPKVTAKDQGAVALFLVVAAAGHALTAWYQHDWLIACAMLTFMYGGFAFACHKMNKDFVFEALHKETIDAMGELLPNPKALDDVKAVPPLILGVGLGLGVALVAWCLFAPWGPSNVYFQTPFFHSYKDWLYWAFFGVFFVLLFPIAETLFVFGFARAAFNGGKVIVLAILYTLVQAVWIYWSLRGRWACWLWIGLSFAVAWGLHNYSHDNGVLKTAGIRVGINIGLFIVLILLYVKTMKGQPLKSPYSVYIVDIRNAWLSKQKS